MINAEVLSVYGSLFVAGLAASLHCIGMCGPILAAFSQVFERAQVTIEGRPNRGWCRSQRPVNWRVLLLDFTPYHLGRIWTYALLGFAVGIAGQSLRHGAAALGFHQVGGVIIGLAVILSGLVLLDIVPGFTGLSSFRTGDDGATGTCARSPLNRFAWFNALLHGRGPLPRVLLGAVMGLIPCGLVYAMLAVVASLPTPWHSALGMIAFGLGTLPSLTAVLLASGALPARLRAQGSRIAAVLVVMTGSWMIVRTLLPHDHAAHAAHASHAEHSGRAPASVQLDHAADNTNKSTTEHADTRKAGPAAELDATLSSAPREPSAVASPPEAKPTRGNRTPADPTCLP